MACLCVANSLPIGWLNWSRAGRWQPHTVPLRHLGCCSKETQFFLDISKLMSRDESDRGTGWFWRCWVLGTARKWTNSHRSNIWGLISWSKVKRNSKIHNVRFNFHYSVNFKSWGLSLNTQQHQEDTFQPKRDKNVLSRRAWTGLGEIQYKICCIFHSLLIHFIIIHVSFQKTQQFYS